MSQDYIYISHCPTWGGREKPYVTQQVGHGWWHRFMSPAFATLQEAVDWANEWCKWSKFALVPKSRLPGWFQGANNPQEFSI